MERGSLFYTGVIGILRTQEIMKALPKTSFPLCPRKIYKKDMQEL